jgi:hypothetical protein
MNVAWARYVEDSPSRRRRPDGLRCGDPNPLHRRPRDQHIRQRQVQEVLLMINAVIKHRQGLYADQHMQVDQISTTYVSGEVVLHARGRKPLLVNLDFYEVVLRA